MFRRKTLKRLTRFGLCFYIMMYYMSFTVCAAEYPISDMMAAAAVSGFDIYDGQKMSTNDGTDVIVPPEVGGSISDENVSDVSDGDVPDPSDENNASVSDNSVSDPSDESDASVSDNAVTDSPDGADSEKTILIEAGTSYNAGSTAGAVSANGDIELSFNGDTTSELMQAIRDNCIHDDINGTVVIEINNDLKADLTYSDFGNLYNNINSSFKTLEINGNGHTIRPDTGFEDNMLDLIRTNDGLFSEVDNLTISNITFCGDSNKTMRSALYLVSINNAVIDSCRFENNVVNSGVINNQNISSLTLQNCIFSQNRKVSDTYGSILFANMRGLNIYNSVFESNFVENGSILTLNDIDSYDMQ